MSNKDNDVDLTHVVLRNGFRVSNSEYTSNEGAQYEFSYWKRLLTNWPDGSKLWVAEIRRKRRPTETQEEKV